MSALLASVPTTPFIEFMEKQQAAIDKGNVQDNQDSFKGVEEFDMNVVPAVSEVFSQLFEELDTENNLIVVENQQSDVKCTSSPCDIVPDIQYENHVFMDASSSVDRSVAIDFRNSCRTGKHTGQTSGIASGFVQANMVSLPKKNAAEFMEFVKANPKGCPLLGITTPGTSTVPSMGEGCDLKTDLPKYRIWKDGVLTEEVIKMRAFRLFCIVFFFFSCFLFVSFYVCSFCPPFYILFFII
jgi:hypothetical protein